ncbi:MAG: Ycf66 family protein [Cyanobium sp.]
MVNAALNWASIVGIVLAVGGAVLYFVRNFKPALARDYDVFFAAVGLLCGGILFFQGWRLDPILQFGQFLLAGSTVFFAYESVRLRGVTTEQARRSAYFDEEEPPPFRPRGGLGGGSDWDRERLEQSEPIRRRIRSREEEDDFYRPRRSSRPAIPERAASRRGEPDDWDAPRREPSAEEGPRGRTAGWGASSDEDQGRPATSRYSAGGSRTASAPFGARRQERDNGPELRRGSRPVARDEAPSRTGRRPLDGPASTSRGGYGPEAGRSPGRPEADAGVPQGTPIRREARPDAPAVRDADFAPVDSEGGSGSRRTPSSEASAPSRSAPVAGRDNSSRFDD